MNPYLVAAAVLAFVVGLVHSVLGERLIFRRLRTGQVVPTNGGTVLRESHVRILWLPSHGSALSPSSSRLAPNRSIKAIRPRESLACLRPRHVLDARRQVALWLAFMASRAQSGAQKFR
jgi:hypothetical protein